MTTNVITNVRVEEEGEAPDAKVTITVFSAKSRVYLRVCVETLTSKVTKNDSLNGECVLSFI
jgi:hypothetical protein